MSPSFAPSSMKAAITSVYIVIAVCTPWIDVFRSATICEIATFMTLESSTITNCADARMRIGAHLRKASAAPERTSARAQLLREELQGLARLRRLGAGRVDVALGEEGAALGGDLEGLCRAALRRELEDARPVGIEPQLDHHLAREPGRRGLELEHEDGPQEREVLERDPLGRVLGEEGALLLGEQLAQRRGARGHVQHRRS